MPTQWRGLVRSPVRRRPEVEQAIVERWHNAADDDLWSVADAAWLANVNTGTIARRIRDGTLAATTDGRHGWRRIRTSDLRPLVAAGQRDYGPQVVGQDG